VIAMRLNQPLSVFLADPAEEDEELLDVLLRNARLLSEVHEHESALKTLEKAYRISVQSSNTEGQLEILEKIGLTQQRLGRYDEALDTFERFIELARTTKRLERVARGYNYLGNTAYMNHHFRMAKHYYRRALKETFNRKSLMDVRQKLLINLGNCLLRLGEYSQGAAAYQEAVELFAYLGEKRLLAYACMGLGCAHRRLRELDKAAQQFRRSIQLFEELGDKGSSYLVRLNMAAVEVDRGSYAAAAAELQTCLEVFRNLGWVSHEAAALEELARCRHGVGDTRAAIALLKQALRILLEQDDPVLRGELYVSLGKLYLAADDPARGVEFLAMGSCLLRYTGNSAAAADLRQTLEQVLNRAESR